MEGSGYSMLVGGDEAARTINNKINFFEKII
jgi:hypothetical protein